MSRLWPWLVASVASLWFFGISAATYLGGSAGAFDFGYYLQSIALIAHGVLNPTPALYPTHTYLADNIALYAYPLAAIYRLWQSPFLLIAAQSLVLGATAGVLAYAIARLSLPRWGRWATIALVLLYPPAMAIAWELFHFDPLGGLLALLLLLALTNGRTRVAWLLVPLTLAVKEDAGLAVLAAALWVWLDPEAEPDGRRAAPWIAAAGITGFILEGMVLMPFLSPQHATEMHRQLFGVTGGLGAEIGVAFHALFWPQKGLYLLALLLPLGGLPLFAWRRLPAIAAAIGVNLLAADTFFSSGRFQYNGFVWPLLVLAAAEGLAVALRSGARLRRWNAAVLLAAAAVVGQAEANWPVVTAVRAAAASVIYAPEIARAQATVTNGTVYTTDVAGGYLASLPGDHTLPLADDGTYLAQLPAFARYTYVAFDRPELAASGGELQDVADLLRRSGYRTILDDGFFEVLERRPGDPGNVRLVYGPWHTVNVQWRQADGVLQAFLPVHSGIWEAGVVMGRGGHGTLCADVGRPLVCNELTVLTQVGERQVALDVPRGKRMLHLDIYVEQGTPHPAIVSDVIRLRSIRYDR